MLHKIKDTSRELNIAYRDTFKTPQGERVLADLRMNMLPEKLCTDNPHETAKRAALAERYLIIERRIEDGVAGKPIR